MMNRIDSLDWQRGLLAFAIMVYHLTGWELHELDSSSLLGRFGIYGVSMFFVLSGLSMAIVYSRFIQGAESSARFLIRRIFRIWPLLWLTIAFATGAAVLAGQAPNWRMIALNLTTAFGFIDPKAYLNIGAWSIGNEMVYYALTPLVIMAFNRSRVLGNLLTASAAAVGGWFAFAVLTPEQILASQWAQYINPFNNLFLYCAGIALFYNFKQMKLSARANGGILAAALAVFVLYPATGDQIGIVTGAGRIIFCAASIMMVLGFYKNTIPLPAVVALPLTHLGVVTYGVYLLHPIAYRTIIFVLKKQHMQLPPALMIVSTILSTVIMALISYRVLEEPFIRIGKRLTKRQAAVAAPVAA